MMTGMIQHGFFLCSPCPRSLLIYWSSFVLIIHQDRNPSCIFSRHSYQSYQIWTGEMLQFCCSNSPWKVADVMVPYCRRMILCFCSAKLNFSSGFHEDVTVWAEEQSISHDLFRRSRATDACKRDMPFWVNDQGLLTQPDIFLQVPNSSSLPISHGELYYPTNVQLSSRLICGHIGPNGGRERPLGDVW